jgi:hypothetical protein
LYLPDDGSGPETAPAPPPRVGFGRRPPATLVLYDHEKVAAARAELPPDQQDDPETNRALVERFAVNRADDEGSR